MSRAYYGWGGPNGQGTPFTVVKSKQEIQEEREAAMNKKIKNLEERLRKIEATPPAAGSQEG